MDKEKGFLVKEDKKKNTIESIIFLALCVLVIVFCYLFFNYAVKEVIVSGPSMEKTLVNGDVLYLSVGKKAELGDVVVIKGEKGNEWIIKRVIGLGGDHIEIKDDGYVYRNGEKLVEDYNQYGKTERNSWVARTLGEDEVFFLGDNRRVSADSRSSFGTCTLDQVVGVVPEFSIKIKNVTNFFYYKIKIPILNFFTK